MTTETNMFERASREKTRIPYCGMCSVEDLWDLSVQKLDGIFQTRNAKLNAEKEESLLGPKTRGTSELALQVAIIRHIVEVKFAEAAAAETAEVHRQKNARLLSILADRSDKKLEELSDEEILQMLEDE